MAMSNAKTEAFCKYVQGFYGKGGIYDLGLEAWQIREAVFFFRSPEGKPFRCGAPFIGDSGDRERVRGLIEKKYLSSSMIEKIV